MSDQAEGQSVTEERGRHATNLELFLDLVFVFAVTQVAGVLGSDLSPEGFGRGLLLAWLVWWLWSQFTWLGTAVRLENRSIAQFQVLATVPLTLLMAVALPSAFDTTGIHFAGAYLAVNLWALGIQGRSLWRDPLTRTAWLHYVPLAAFAPCVLFAGSLLEGGLRVGVWTAVAAFQIGSALAAARRGREGTSEWSIDPVHFAERHALFVIISLGEIVVAIGASGASVELEPVIGLGLVSAVAVTCTFWWTYFAFVPAVAERQLRTAHGAQRANVARNLFTFGHFPIVFGLVLFAVAAKHAVGHPTDPLSSGDLMVLAGAVTSFVGGLLRLQWQVVRRLAPERVIVVVAVAAACWIIGPGTAGGLLLAMVATLIAIMQAITVRRFERTRAARS